MDNVNDLINFADYKDEDDSRWKRPGDKVYADADSSGLWQVYEKQDPYTAKVLLAPDVNRHCMTKNSGHRR